MIFLSKLVLIVLLNETFAYITQDIEIILLPASNLIGAKEIPLTLKVFGHLIQLNLRRNNRIISSTFGVWKYNAKSVTEKLLQLNISSHCQYYHENHISSAVVNFCHEDGLVGLIFVENNTFEIWPLQNKFMTLCFIDDFGGQTNLSFGKPHVIKKSLQYFADSNLYHWDMFKVKERRARNAQHNLTIELAIFFDETAYKTSMFLAQHNEVTLHNMILAYVNRIQDTFNRPRSNVFMNIALIRSNILKKQPSNLSLSDGDVDQLLDLFCKYANSFNFPDDDPLHWDIGLYLTGLSLYEKYLKYIGVHAKIPSTERHYYITGKSYHDGACNPLFSCAVLEFHNFTSSFDAVYQINNLLGLIQEGSSSDSEMYAPRFKDNLEKLWEEKICLRDQAKTIISKTEIVDDTQKNELNIELAIFFDKAAYNMYMPILDNDETKLRKMILAYVNQIQALFHHESFGTSANISLVHLEIIKSQPLNLLVTSNAGALLFSFCQYANFLKLQDKNRLHHWDIALLLTGTDLYEMTNKQKNHGVIGWSYSNATCNDFSCGIVGFGTTNLKTFSGFQTFRTAAHEIGHLLGIKHDLDYINWTCSKDTKFDKHIMASVRYYRGQVTWSECSRNVTKELWKKRSCLLDHTKKENLEDALDHSRYHDLPGREWTAKAQCQLFLRDKDANVVTLHDICQVLQCETPHKNKYFFAGPALDGTYCAVGKECRGGKCVPVIEPPYILPYCAQDNWSEWKEDSCKSNCMRKSKGVVVKRRFCKHETYKTASCSGPYYDVVLCDDSSLCTKGRDSFFVYTDSKCIDYDSKLEREEYFDDVIEEPGWQEPHDIEKPWIACTIFCLKYWSLMGEIYYSFRLEMLKLGIDPYLPDGTWCHNEDGQDYYCRQHYCLPENYSNEK